MTDQDVEEFLEKYCIVEGEPPTIENGIVKRADYVSFKPNALALTQIPVIFEVIAGSIDCVNLGCNVEFVQYPIVNGTWYLGSDKQITKAFLLHLIASTSPVKVDVSHSDEWRMASLRNSYAVGERGYAATDYSRIGLLCLKNHLQRWYGVQMAIATAKAPFEAGWLVPSLGPSRYNRIGWCSVHFNYGRKGYEPRKDIPFRRVGLFLYVYECLKQYWQSRDYLTLLDALQGTVYARYLQVQTTSVSDPISLDAL